MFIVQLIIMLGVYSCLPLFRIYAIHVGVDMIFMHPPLPYVLCRFKKGYILLSFLCHVCIICHYLLELDHSLNYRISYSAFYLGWIGVIIIAFCRFFAFDHIATWCHFQVNCKLLVMLILTIQQKNDNSLLLILNYRSVSVLGKDVTVTSHLW